MRAPDALYVGADKAGSTWLHRVLEWHPQTFVPRAKDVFYFDRNYHRGHEWYRARFAEARPDQVVVDVSHDYLHSPESCRRIRHDLPDARIIVFVREPIQRAFSAYLFLCKHGLERGSFAEAIRDRPEIVERSFYASAMAEYIGAFGRDRVHVGVFDDLRADPDAFARSVFRFLEVDERPLSSELHARILPAARPRATWLARLVKRGAVTARRAGLGTVVGHLKRSPVVNHVLYAEYEERHRPRPDDATREALRGRFADDVRALDRMLGTDLARRWGYAES